MPLKTCGQDLSADLMSATVSHKASTHTPGQSYPSAPRRFPRDEDLMDLLAFRMSVTGGQERLRNWNLDYCLLPIIIASPTAAPKNIGVREVSQDAQLFAP